MAVTYSRNFSLLDIFNNKNLKGKLPLINYREKELDNGKISVRTYGKTVNAQVFEISKKAARPYYSAFFVAQDGNRQFINGEMTGDQDACIDAVYQALMNTRTNLLWTANNADMIRDALKESEKNKREYGINSKLYLRATSMQQIEGMSRPQLQALMTDIMDNIIYGDDFPKTQKKWQVQEMKVNSPLSYEQRKLRWKYKIGD